MYNSPVGRCEGCGEAIYRFSGLVFTCPYCYEQYTRKSPEGWTLVRITETLLPLTCEVQTKQGTTTVNLCDIRQRFEDADKALKTVLADYKESCRIYESVRPPASKRIRRVTAEVAFKPLTKGFMFNCSCSDLWKYSMPAIKEWFAGASRFILENDYPYEFTIKSISYETTSDWHVDILIEVEEKDAPEGIYPVIARIY